jgi:two-component system, LytTR family, response regulator
MNVLIIEDEYPAAERLQKLIQRTAPDAIILGTLESVAEGLRWFNNPESPKPDLIFSDIELTDGLSFEIYEQLGVQCPVIFTTSYDEYALRAFELNSLHYLLKPIKPTELASAINKYRQWEHHPNEAASQVRAAARQLSNHRTRFLIETAERVFSLPVSDAAYFYTREGNVYVVTHQGQRYPLALTLEELELQLPNDKYFRANRQYLVHLQSLRQGHQYFGGKLKLDIHPAPNEDVMVSRERATTFKKWLDGALE